jgi:enoyl-CoA hydratase/carnithine racemase
MSPTQRREEPLALARREDRSGVATLTLQSPASRNALSLAMIEALIDAFVAIEADPATRVVVLAGDGPALSAGHDLKELQAHRNDADRGRAFFERAMTRCADLMRAIVALEKPVIAAVEGVATAACDLAIAGAEARFALPGVSIGLFCSTPLVAVGRAVSRKHAMEMALTGDLYDAETAERFGLVNRVVPVGAALAEAHALAQRIAARSAATLAIGKRAYYRQIDMPLDEAYALAGRAMIDNLLHPDSAEGAAAFLDKRPPHWEGA